MKKQITEFQEKVYNATRKIPRGRVTTYKLLANAIECGSAQAVGQALKRNPFAPEVPCHRVISSSLTIGGFKGEGEGGDSSSEKIRLLAEEGVVFIDNKLVDESFVHRF